MKDLFKPEDFTCSICGKVTTPIFSTPDKDGVAHLYCGEHNPITQEERHQWWGVTPEMLRPREKRGRPKGSYGKHRNIRAKRMLTQTKRN